MTLASRHAPLVLYPVRRSHALGYSLVMAHLAAMGVLVGWIGLGAGSAPGWSVVIAACAWCLAAGGALHFLGHQLSGAIRWDGQSWAMADDRYPEAAFVTLSNPPQVLMDVQSHLWLLVSTAGSGSLSLWLERSSQPERWMDLRRAVYSRAKLGHGLGASAPADSRSA